MLPWQCARAKKAVYYGSKWNIIFTNFRAEQVLCVVRLNIFILPNKWTLHQIRNIRDQMLEIRKWNFLINLRCAGMVSFAMLSSVRRENVIKKIIGTDCSDFKTDTNEKCVAKWWWISILTKRDTARGSVNFDARSTDRWVSEILYSND